jgi:hypothetical protein
MQHASQDDTRPAKERRFLDRVDQAIAAGLVKPLPSAFPVKTEPSTPATPSAN